MLLTEEPICHYCISASGDTVRYVLILCRVNTEIGLYMWGNWCEINISANTTPPGAFLWSIIYVLKRAKKLYLKINFFAFFLKIFKGSMCIEYLCMLMLVMNVKREKQRGFRKEEREIKSKRRKASESCWDVRLMWYHADRACCVCVCVCALPLQNSSSASCHSDTAVGPQ